MISGILWQQDDSSPFVHHQVTNTKPWAVDEVNEQDSL